MAKKRNPFVRLASVAENDNAGKLRIVGSQKKMPLGGWSYSGKGSATRDAQPFTIIRPRKPANDN